MIIGLDGATFDLLKPWSQAGHLPSLKRLMQSGAHGVLKSTVPWTTVPAWTSFATGKNPGKHGCYDFRLPTNSLGHSRLVTSADIPGKTFYELVTEAGKKATLINLPVSYPPRIPGTVITSLMTRGPQFVFPPELVEAVPELLEYRIVAGEQTTEDIRAVERLRFSCARRLFNREWDLFFLLFSGSDHVSHRMYSEMLEEQTPEKGGKVFEDLDRYLGWFVDNLPPDANLFVISDHGFQSMPGILYINSWLAQEGYLALGGDVRPEGEDLLSRLDCDAARARQLNLGRLSRFLFHHPFLYRTGKAVYHQLKSLLPFGLSLDSHGVKLEQTQAFAATNECKGIYINDARRFVDGTVSEEDVSSLREEVIRKLEALEGPGGKEKAIARVWRKEDLYWGEHLEYAPDIVLEPNHFVSFLLRSAVPFENTPVNYHSADGILVASGPDIGSGAVVEDAQIIDIAPTVLHLMDLPIPTDMDGKVLRRAFRAGSDPAVRQDRFQKGTGSETRRQSGPSEEDLDEVRSRLRALGYWA